MRKFAFGMVALAGVAALAGSAEARERRFLFFRYDDGRNYSQPMNYQPAPQQQQAQTPPAAPPAQEAVQTPVVQAPAAQPAQAPATQPAQPMGVQQPMQQQYYNNNYNNNGYNNRSNGGFFDGIMEFERRKNAWLFGR